MDDASDIIKTVHQRINDCLLVQAWWRANEIRDNYCLVEGDQWLEDARDRQNLDGMPARTVNKSAIVIDSVCGFEIQNRSEVNYVPRLPTDSQMGFSDMVNDGVKYIEQACNAAFHNSLAFKDMLVCGVGVTDTIISYDNNPDGETIVERVFPYLTLWDVAARGKNLEDANWVIRAKVVDKDAMEGYIKEAMDQDEVDANFGASIDARFLDFFNTVMITKSLGIIYEYQWREKIPFYRVNNPLVGFMGDPMDPYAQQIVQLAKTLQEKYKFDVTKDRVFSIDSKDRSALKEAFELLGLPFKAIKQKKYKYYRATVVGNKLFDKEENFSQTGFSLKFMTGKFSEVRQCYYGMMRAMKEAQRMYNQAISDYEGFLRTVPKGGVIIESDAVPNMEAFVQTYTKARQVMIVNPGALAGGKIMPKPAVPVPPGLLDMISFSSAAMLEATGVTPEFMGLNESKEMTATLNRQLVRQGLTVLSAYFDAKKFYTIAQGKLFIDCLRVMAENAEGRLIRVMNDGEAQFIPLLNDGIAAEYDVIVEDVPQTPTERQDTFEKLLQLSGILLNKPNPIDITPMLMQFSPLKDKQQKEVLDAMKPPPPQPPDPVTQGLLIAETKLKESVAEKNMAEIPKIQIDALLKQQELMQGDNRANAEIQKILSDVQLNQTKALGEVTKTAIL